MRFFLTLASIVAAAFAQTESATSSSLAFSSTSVPYTNGFTSFLTMTNSLGVVTGMPTQPTNPAAITTQPTLQTIPAGLTPGLHTIVMNISSSLTSFQVSVGQSTTQVLAPSPSPATTDGGSGSQSGASGNGGSGQSGSAGSNSASSSTSSHGAAATVHLASGGLLGLGALALALL